jgi:hypothetical protein
MEASCMKILSNVVWDYVPPKDYKADANSLKGLDKPHIQIKDIETAHGYLVVSYWDHRCYWGLQDWDGIIWEEISMVLFIILVKHQRGELLPLPGFIEEVKDE